MSLSTNKYILYFNRKSSIMKIILDLYVLLILNILTTNAHTNHAEMPGIKRLTERVGSYECNIGGCLLQDEMLDSIDPVVVNKREAKQSIREQIKESKKEATLLKKNMNQEAMSIEKKLNAIANKRRRDLYTLAQKDTNKIVTMSKTETKNRTQHSELMVKQVSVSSGQHTFNFVNQTADVLGKSIRESAIKVGKLSKSYINSLKRFGDKQISNIQKAVNSGDLAGARALLGESSKTVNNLASVGTNKLRDIYLSAEREVKLLASSGADLIIDLAHNQTANIKDKIATNDGNVNVLVENATDRITSFSQEIADMYAEWVKDGLDKSRQMAKNARKAIEDIVKMINDLGYNIIEENEPQKNNIESAISKTVENIEESNTRDLKEVIADLKAKSMVAVDKGHSYVEYLKKFTIV